MWCLGGPRSLQVPKKKSPETCPDCGNRSGAVAIHRVTMGKPKNVEGHRMPSLKTIPKAFAEDKRLGRPGERSLLKRDRVRQREEASHFVPHDLRQRTREQKVSHGLLDGWTTKVAVRRWTTRKLSYPKA